MGQEMSTPRDAEERRPTTPAARPTTSGPLTVGTCPSSADAAPVEERDRGSAVAIVQADRRRLAAERQTAGWCPLIAGTRQQEHRRRCYVQLHRAALAAADPRCYLPSVISCPTRAPAGSPLPGGEEPAARPPTALQLAQRRLALAYARLIPSPTSCAASNLIDDLFGMVGAEILNCAVADDIAPLRFTKAGRGYDLRIEHGITLGTNSDPDCRLALCAESPLPTRGPSSARFSVQRKDGCCTHTPQSPPRLDVHGWL